MRAFILVMPFLFGAVASVHAGQRPIIGDPTGDIVQTIQARKKLADDPDLQDVNIGVIVENRVATLWGPVPSAEVAFRAELCLRTMIELVEVHNDLFVTELREPIRRPLKIDVPPVLKPEQVPPILPPAPRILLSAPGVLMGQDTTQTKQPKSQPMSMKKTPPLSTPQADPSDKLTAAERELAEAVRQVLQSKPALRGVLFAVQERRVYLKAPEHETDALHEASRVIARLPNVDGVILLDKSSER